MGRQSAEKSVFIIAPISNIGGAGPWQRSVLSKGSCFYIFYYTMKYMKQTCLSTRVAL